MKLHAAAALLALLAGRGARATTVYPSEGSGCSPSVAPIWACGPTNMGANYFIRSAKVEYTGQTADFYAERDCKGARVRAGWSDCFPFPFRARCVDIKC